MTTSRTENTPCTGFQHGDQKKAAPKKSNTMSTLQPYNIGLFQSLRSSESYQKSRWRELRRAIDRELSSKDPVQTVCVELFKLNLIRGGNLLIRTIMEKQMNSPRFTTRYAAITAVINSKFENIGKSLVTQLVLQFRKSYMNNNKKVCVSSGQFIASLVNQQVVNEILILQICQLLLEKPSDDGIEVLYEILKTSGKYLSTNSSLAMGLIFDKLHDISRGDALSSNKAHNLVDLLQRWNRSRFEKTQITEEYDLVEDDDKITHLIELTQSLEPVTALFEFDPKYEENERAYTVIRTEILGEQKDEEVQEEEQPQKQEKVVDATENELLMHQKTVYLNIMSSMSADEAVHKLVKLTLMKKDKTLNNELIADMVIKCCCHEKTYSKFFGAIGEKMCLLNRNWPKIYTTLFKKYYEGIEKLENNAIRNLGKFFGHLFVLQNVPIGDAWNEVIITEDDTTAASRIFLKFIFQEMIEEEGASTIKMMIQQAYGEINGMFPVKDVSWKDADHIRFSINYFTAIGLGVLTEDMRVVLKDLPPDPSTFERGRTTSRLSSFSRSGSSRSSSYSRSPSRDSAIQNGRTRNLQRINDDNTDSRTPSRDAKRQRRG